MPRLSDTQRIPLAHAAQHGNASLYPLPASFDDDAVSVDEVRPPRAVVGNLGENVLPLVSAIDRQYPDDFKRQKWVFGKATDEVIATFVERKVYWETTLKSKSPPSRKEREKDGAPSVV